MGAARPAAPQNLIHINHVHIIANINSSVNALSVVRIVVNIVNIVINIVSLIEIESSILTRRRKR